METRTLNPGGGPASTATATVFQASGGCPRRLSAKVHRIGGGADIVVDVIECENGRITVGWTTPSSPGLVTVTLFANGKPVATTTAKVR